MDIIAIRNQVENALQDKQEFADLCFELMPKLLEKLEYTNDRLSEAEGLISDAHDLLNDVHCYNTDVYHAMSKFMYGDEE